MTIYTYERIKANNFAKQMYIILQDDRILGHPVQKLSEAKFLVTWLQHADLEYNEIYLKGGE